MNASMVGEPLMPLPASAYAYRPFYDVPRSALLPRLCGDVLLSLIAPVVTYWVASAFFGALDWLEMPAIERYRIHEPEEITKRNRVTLAAVIKAVIIQHIIQTAIGLVVLNFDEDAKLGHKVIDPAIGLDWHAAMLTRFALAAFGSGLGGRLLRRYGAEAVTFMYWWGVPALQLVWSFFVLDTWQYFWHRYFHTNKFLYRHVHSVHHRLYVPYACGALYNHPFEGLILDSLGGLVAHLASGMTIRQATVLFVIASLKTVDDHCGLALPWDPLQHLFGNNADYHDIHHQHFGLKANFSQPWFVHWDVLLGTRMTRDQAPRRTHTDAREKQHDAQYHVGKLSDKTE